MKKLLILPLLALMTGCVTYYYPETALEDGVYYAEDDPSYVVYSDEYTGTAYYPWSSLDYFYLGYNPYASYGFGYGYGGYGSGFSFGINYGYSPWYYPYSYHGYDSPRYASYYNYPYYPASRPWRGYCDGHYGCNHRGRNNHRGDGHNGYARNRHDNRRNRADDRDTRNRYDNRRNRADDRYTRNRHDDRRYRGGEDASDKENPVDRRRERSNSSSDASPVRRYVSTTPAGYSGNRGMVIRSRETTKIGKSRLQPVNSIPAPTVRVTPSSSRAARPVSRAARPVSRSTRANNVVRYRSDAKQTRSSTGPVESGSSSNGVAVAIPPSQPVVVPGNSSRRGQQGRTRTTHQVSMRPPSKAAASSTAESKSNKPTGNNKRSRSTASVASHRNSKNRKLSNREKHN